MEQEPLEEVRRVVVSIHGIRSEGEWQDAFRDVFDRHFRFIPFKYGEFRHPVGAVLWIALELWVILLGLVLIFAAWNFHWLDGWKSWVFALFVWLALFLAASFLADNRRDRVIKRFIQEIDDDVHNERNPHVIAHSLGSFLVGRLLLKHPQTSFQHIILMGCVLGRKYGWQKVAKRFAMVRNEVAGRDWVSAIAVSLRFFIPEMGNSGIKGFHEVDGFVRTLKEDEFGCPWRPCVPGCVCGFGAVDSPESRILNVRCEKLGHNDIAKRRARLVWLPFLWDIPPEIHRAFLVLCQDCADLEKKPTLRKNLNEKATTLRTQCWFWTHGPLEALIEEQLQAELGSSPPEVVTLVVRNLWQTVARAARHDATARDEICLHPIFAMDIAVATAIASVR